MPKMKARRSATKRFRLTESGKIKRYKATASHILRKKSSKKKRRLRHSSIASTVDAKRIKKMILN